MTAAPHASRLEEFCDELRDCRRADLIEYLAEALELIESIEKEIDWLAFSWHRHREPFPPHEVVRELTRLRDLVRGDA